MRPVQGNSFAMIGVKCIRQGQITADPPISAAHNGEAHETLDSSGCNRRRGWGVRRPCPNKIADGQGGSWSQPFDAAATADGKFTLSGGEKVNTPLMHRDYLSGGQYGAFNEDGSFFDTPLMVPGDNGDRADGDEQAQPKSPPRYPSEGGFTVLSLPYKGGALSMVFLVPQAADGLSRIESRRADGALADWLGQLIHQPVDSRRLARSADSGAGQGRLRACGAAPP